MALLTVERDETATHEACANPDRSVSTCPAFAGTLGVRVSDLKLFVPSSDDTTSRPCASREDSNIVKRFAGAIRRKAVGWSSLADIDAPSLVLCSDCAHPAPIRRFFIGFPSRPGLGRHSPFLSHTGSQPITVSAIPEEVVIDDFRQSYGCFVFPPILSM